MAGTQTGIMILRDDRELQKRFRGNIGVLCHSASIDEKYQHTLEIMLKCFGDKVKKVYGPQHGLVTDVQDNMIETEHFIHPYFKLPIYSLYSETRVPTDEMLEGIDHLFIDLQDVGTRVYTYIYTMTHTLEKCAEKDIEVIILDRPNPIGLKKVEGNILEASFASFVGRHPIPVRHGLTMAEVALMHQKFWAKKECQLKVIQMQNYDMETSWKLTGRPYVNPSPNLATLSSCFCFVGTVLLEGTNVSEGRGTTRALEQLGHPCLDPWKLQQHFNDFFAKHKIEGLKLRPVYFRPMFQKFSQQTCGGFFLHIQDDAKFSGWKFSQLFVKEFMRLFPTEFSYNTDPYEYGGELSAIDMINGTNKLRAWYEQEQVNASYLDEIQEIGLSEYLGLKDEVSLYK